MIFYEYHKSLEHLHIGALKPRAYFIPFEDITQAREKSRDASSRYKNLSGEWRFVNYKSFENVDCSTVSYQPENTDSITVPRCWQTYTDREYDKPLYSNLQYPFSVDPPNVPDENPCGAYYREFELSELEASRVCTISFEGVASCFYLWINGAFVGYSQVSHCTSEFDITEYINMGKNSVCVLVVKWCDGSYLEDQDFFRLSGIFREVYLLSRNKTHITDIEVKSSICGSTADISVKYTLSDNTDTPVELYLESPCKDCISSLTVNGGSANLTVNNPSLWSDETPDLYTLYLVCGGEAIPVYIGIREVVINNRCLYINNKTVRLRGVNRHDSNPDTGYATSLEDMKRDLYLMKRANVNAIRTSHYPNDPRFVALCDELGFYVIDEADLETHGMGFDYGNTDGNSWDWQRWSLLARLTEWREAYIDRAARLYERDKNNACVIMWSLGNESGVGENHREMAKYIKSRCPGAIVHYENSHLEFSAIPEGEDYSDISDVESRMYAGVGYIEKYLSSPQYTKPFFMCEYVDSMSTGDVYDYWRFADKYENFCGGCIWEFCDHAINAPDKEGNARYYYGGDFGDIPNDGICCIDGMVFPDRTLRPGYYDMKKVYEPFIGKYDNGTLTIRSLLYFTSLSRFSAHWSIECDGACVLDGELPVLDIMAGETKSYKLFDTDKPSVNGNAFLTVRVLQIEDCEWAEAGYEIGFMQFELVSAEKAVTPKEVGAVELIREGKSVTAKANGTVIVFDTAYGLLKSVTVNGVHILDEAVTLDIRRAPCYNRGSSHRWALEGFESAKQKALSVSVTQGDGSVTMSTDITYGGPSNPPVLRGKTEYTLFADGSVSISFDGKVRENAPCLARLGFRLVLPEEFEELSWFGPGPNETYPDRYKSQPVGRYCSTVTDNFIHYIRPQENGEHYKVRSVTLFGNNIKMSAASLSDSDFSFNASHFTAGDIQYTAHDFELVPHNETYLNLDWRVNAISENGELANKENKRLLTDKTASFAFLLKFEAN